MKLRRMLALTLVLMTLMTAALAADDHGLYYIGDDATPENLTGHTRIYTPAATAFITSTPNALSFQARGRSRLRILPTKG